MGAITTDEVGEALVPHVARLLGGKGALLVDRHGRVLAAAGMAPTETAYLGRLLAEPAGTAWPRHRGGAGAACPPPRLRCPRGAGQSVHAVLRQRGGVATARPGHLHRPGSGPGRAVRADRGVACRPRAGQHRSGGQPRAAPPDGGVGLARVAHADHVHHRLRLHAEPPVGRAGGGGAPALRREDRPPRLRAQRSGRPPPRLLRRRGGTSAGSPLAGRPARRGGRRLRTARPRARGTSSFGGGRGHPGHGRPHARAPHPHQPVVERGQVLRRRQPHHRAARGLRAEPGRGGGGGRLGGGGGRRVYAASDDWGGPAGGAAGGGPGRGGGGGGGGGRGGGGGGVARPPGFVPVSPPARRGGGAVGSGRRRRRSSQPEAAYCVSYSSA